MNIQLEVVFVLLLFMLLVWLIPMILVLNSTRTHGKEKLGLLIAMVSISWLAWALYLLFAPLKPNVKCFRE
ncbi:hypothetical protein ACK14S_03760 [Vibrio natriegens]